MAARLPNIFNIPAGAPFLEILADEVLKGFPLYPKMRSLPDWTILLPTRRSVRVFTEILHRKSGAGALLLPRIKPMGDLDEDRLGEDFVTGALPEPMPPLAALLELSNLARDWARAHPEVHLAQELLASPLQLLNLSKSLVEFITTVETQECDAEKLSTLYDGEWASHRETILGLLDLVLQKLPAIAAREGRMGATARRSKMLRLEAARILSHHHGPIIAAGSTGTIPATRALLKAIALHEEGAVILPGLDLVSDEANWGEITEEHPQAALKNLLAELGATRADVRNLARETARQRLSSELFRPSSTAARWHETLPRLQTQMQQALDGVTEIAAPDRHMEARAIALIFREVLETPGKTALLVTPDRDLAQRVGAEMLRWDVTVADSAGQPLRRHGLGSALDLLLKAFTENFTPESLMAFLRHPLVNAGEEQAAWAHLLSQFEVAVLRGPLFAGLTWAQHLAQAKARHGEDYHAHPLIKSLTDEDWNNLAALADKADALTLLLHEGADFIVRLEHALLLSCGEAAFADPEHQPVLDLLANLGREAPRRSEATPQELALLLRDLLAQTKQAQHITLHPRLAILGTLEARLMQADVLVLGGLNEGIWPAQVDTGPWLNRKMRDSLSLPQPERDIGLAAHDFEQGLAAPRVYLTWSKRIGDGAPQASRWLLRLHAVMAAANITPDENEATRILSLAAALDQPDHAKGPAKKPKPMPPVSARPTKFSVTEIEKLIRDPYAVYARRILNLTPLDGFDKKADHALRGQLFHDAIGDWNKAQARDLQSLMAAGEKAFAALDDKAREKKFWWPHFERVARFLADMEEELRRERLRIHAEISGRIEFPVAGITHTLTARADRMDILANGALRIIDYKTGSPPTADQVGSNFSPQLTLEAAIAVAGGFKPIKAKSAQEALYMQIGAGRSGLKKSNALPDKNLDDVAKDHFDNLVKLLTYYLSPTQPYLPRLRLLHEQDESDFDHLSRYLEWQLAEGKA